MFKFKPQHPEKSKFRKHDFNMSIFDKFGYLNFSLLIKNSAIQIHDDMPYKVIEEFNSDQFLYYSGEYDEKS